MFGRKKSSMKEVDLVRPGVVSLQGREISYNLVRVRSRKKMTVLVTKQGVVEVRVPLRVTIRQAEIFLVQCSEWVLQRLVVVEKQILQRPQLVDGAAIPFLGETVTLRFDVRAGRGIERDAGKLLVPVLWSQDEQQLQKRLELWFKRQARGHLSSRLAHWANIMEVEYNRLTIRSQKTIWGSCSAKNNINLNWRLMWTPYRVADYVVIHELCHLDYMDHSAQFWQRVSHFEPDYRRVRSQLRNFKSPW